MARDLAAAPRGLRAPVRRPRNFRLLRVLVPAYRPSDALLPEVANGGGGSSVAAGDPA